MLVGCLLTFPSTQAPPSVPLSIIIGNLLPFKYSELKGSSYLYTFLRILRWESFFLFSFPFTDRSPHFLYMFICLLLVEVCNRYAREGLPVGVGWPPSRNNCTVKWLCPWQLSRDGGSPCVVCAVLQGELPVSIPGCRTQEGVQYNVLCLVTVVPCLLEGSPCSHITFGKGAMLIFHRGDLMMAFGPAGQSWGYKHFFVSLCIWLADGFSFP